MPYTVRYNCRCWRCKIGDVNAVFRDPGGRVLGEWCGFSARSVCSVRGDSGLWVGCFFVGYISLLGLGMDLGGGVAGTGRVRGMKSGRRRLGGWLRRV